MICRSAYGGAIEIRVSHQALYKFSITAKRNKHLFSMMPQHHRLLYKFSSSAKYYTNLVGMIPQLRQELYTNSLEEHHAGVMQCARLQHPFQDPSQEQLTVDVEFPGVM